MITLGESYIMRKDLRRSQVLYRYINISIQGVAMARPITRIREASLTQTGGSIFHGVAEFDRIIWGEVAIFARHMKEICFIKMSEEPLKNLYKHQLGTLKTFIHFSL